MKRFNILLLILLLLPPLQTYADSPEPTPYPILVPTPSPTVTPLWPTDTPTPPVTPTPVPVACADTLEPNAEPGSGKLLVSGDTLNSLTLSPQGDVDFFLLWGKAGDFYRITTHTTEGVDTRLRIYDPNGNLVAENDDYQKGNPAAQLNFQAPGDGFFAVAVDSRVPTDWGCRAYSIDALTVAAPTVTPTLTPFATPYPTAIPGEKQPDVFEPNYDPAHATNIGVGQSLALNFNPAPPDSDAVDNDFFRLYAKAGQVLKIETTGLAPGLDTNLIVIADDGVTAISGNDDCTVGQLASCLSWSPESNQLVYLLVGPVGTLPEQTNAGARNYTLSVTDLSGQATPSVYASGGGLGINLPAQTAPPTATSTATLMPSPTTTATPVIRIRYLDTRVPTSTPEPLFSVNIGIQVYYDQNNNHAPDADEGIAGISVRVLDSQNNRLLAHVFTNNDGYAAITVAAPQAVRVSVPYLGFNKQVRSPGDTLNIRLAPLRLPSLIP